VPWLVQGQFLTVGEHQRRDQAEPFLADLRGELDALRLKLGNRRADVVAHEIQLVMSTVIRGVRGELSRRQLEDEPAASGIDRRQAQNVVQEGADRLWILREDDRVHTSDHDFDQPTPLASALAVVLLNDRTGSRAGEPARVWLVLVGAWGAASFENDSASDWFYLVEEAVEPGGVIASALDHALGEADYLDLDSSCAAIAAAELSACCAGQAPDGLPDHIRRWVYENPHRPHDSEIEHAVQAVVRVRSESELRELWDDGELGHENAWLREVDDLIARLRRSGTDAPATLRP
jgi:hypothetical protein